MELGGKDTWRAGLYTRDIARIGRKPTALDSMRKNYGQSMTGAIMQGSS